MENSSIRKVKEVFSQAKSIRFNNQTIRLTPEEVTTFDDSGIIPPPWKQGLLTAHYETIYNKDNQCSKIHEKSWTFKEEYTNKSQQWTAGIYTCGAKFPELCVACMKPLDNYEVVELLESKNISTGKFTIPGTTQREADRISYASFWDRFWIPVPFCREHSLKSKAIFIRKGGDEFTFRFKNKQYGELFAELNKLKGFWRTKSNLFTYKVLFPFLFILSGLGIFSGILLSIRGFNGQLGKAIATPTDIPVGIILVVFPLIMIIIIARRMLNFETTRIKKDQK